MQVVFIWWHDEVYIVDFIRICIHFHKFSIRKNIHQYSITIITIIIIIIIYSNGSITNSSTWRIRYSSATTKTTTPICCPMIHSTTLVQLFGHIEIFLYAHSALIYYHQPSATILLLVSFIHLSTYLSVHPTIEQLGFVHKIKFVTTL